MVARRYNKDYNLEEIESYMQRNKDNINSHVTDALRVNEIDIAVQRLDHFISDMHRSSVNPKK